MSDRCFACVGHLDVKYSDFDKRWYNGPWVIKIKTPTILCARSTWRENEQSNKHRSRSENIWNVYLFYSQINKIVWLSNMTETFIKKFARCAKVCGPFFLIVLFGRWLAGQANSDHMEYMRKSWLKLFKIMLYIRETGRRLWDRFHEHLLDVLNN